MKSVFCVLLLIGGNAFGYSVFGGLHWNVAPVEYAGGVAAIQTGDVIAGKQLLTHGWLRSGNDRLFLSQLAGAAYRAGDRQTAKKHLFELLKAEPENEYANQFLGTLFLLDGNLEAALKYWNRIEQPRVLQLEIQPELPIDAEVLDQAIVVAPASTFKRSELLATQSRFAVMDVFKKQEFLLRPNADGSSFDLVMRARLKRGTFSSKYKMATVAAQAVFADTIQLDFPNINGTTINSSSLLSWDEYKHRASSSISFPFAGDPHARIRVFAEAKRETWALTAGDLRMSHFESGIEFVESNRSGFTWRGGAILSDRSFVGENQNQAFHQGWQVQASGSSSFSLLRVPEHRFDLTSTSTIRTGTFLGQTNLSGAFDQRFAARWYPKPAGEDLVMHARFSMGKSFGDVPFDDYFTLGANKHSDLLLRSHRSSIEKKGENPFSTSFYLLNWDISKQMLKSNRFRWRFAPFVDAAKISGHDLWTGDQWFLDVGVQSGFQVYGSTELVLTYGKDLQNGRNVIYLSATL